MLHLGITPRLKRKLSEIPFRPPFAAAGGAAVERKGESEGFENRESRSGLAFS